FTYTYPRRNLADRRRNDLAKKAPGLNAGNRRERFETGDQSQNSEGTNAQSKPKAARSEIKSNKPDERDDEGSYRHIGPLPNANQLVEAPRSNHDEFANRDSNYSEGREGENQMRTTTLPDADEQMRQCEDDTSPNQHSPDERNPAHGQPR